MYAQVDPSGRSHAIIDCILDFKKNDTAISKDDMYITTKSGRRRMRQSTLGWKFLIRHKDGSEVWTPLKLLKEFNPIEVAEFATARGINEEPAFSWWIPYTLRRRDRIISADNKRVKILTLLVAGVKILTLFSLSSTVRIFYGVFSMYDDASIFTTRTPRINLPHAPICIGLEG